MEAHKNQNGVNSYISYCLTFNLENVFGQQSEEGKIWLVSDLSKDVLTLLDVCAQSERECVLCCVSNKDSLVRDLSQYGDVVHAARICIGENKIEADRHGLFNTIGVEVGRRDDERICTWRYLSKAITEDIVSSS